MRKITATQKKLLKQWHKENYRECEYAYNQIARMDSETYNKIDSINPCEIFEQNANRYLEELSINK